MKRGPIIAALIALVAIVWIMSGQAGDENGESIASTSGDASSADDAKEKSVEVVLPSVRVLESVAQPRIQEISLFGRTEAERYVDVRAETDGLIVALNVEEGDLISDGDLIARLAINDRQARVDDAFAQVKYREVAFEAAEELSKKQFRSEVQLAEELSALESARAALIIARVELARTRINAPFGGVVEELYVEHGKSVQAGDTILRINDLDPIVVAAQITERDIDHVELGQRARIRLASGREYEGVVGYIANTANTETRTFRIEIKIANPDIDISAGLTAEVGLFTKPVLAHHVSPAVLTLDDLGRIGIKTVDGNDQVAFFPIEIIADTAMGIWISGIPDQSRIISVGQEFVLPGQTVDSVAAGS